MSFNSNIDILKKVADLENLKCSLLSGTADFFKAATETRGSDQNGADALCAILTTTYLLAAQLGVGFDELDARAAARLRNNVLKNEAPEDVRRLLKYLTK